MSKNSETPSSKRWQNRKKAVALSLGTCLLMGITAFEIVRAQNNGTESPKQPHNPLIVLANPQDSRLHRDLSEIEAKMYETKRLLFSRENALENSRMRSIREKLQHKTDYAAQLENANEQLKKDIETEKQKILDIEKTKAALLDTVEMHKNIAESTRQEQLAQMNTLKEELEKENLKLQNQLRHLEENELALIEALESKEEAVTQVLAESAHQVISLKDLLDTTTKQVAYSEVHAKNLKSVAEDLRDEVEKLEAQLREHEQIDVDQQRALTENEQAHEIERQKLLADLEQVKMDLEREIAKGQSQGDKNLELEESLKHLIVKSASRDQDLNAQILKHREELEERERELDRLSSDSNSLRKALGELTQEHEQLQSRFHEKLSDYERLEAMIERQKQEQAESAEVADQRIFLSAKSGAELQDELFLTRADAKTTALRMNEELELKSRLERDLFQLKNDLDIHHKLAQNVQDAFEKKIEELNDLTVQLNLEKEEALALAKRWQFVEPIRYVEKEDELHLQIETLEQNLADLRRHSTKLEEKMAEEKNLAQDLAYQLENQTYLRATEREEELSQQNLAYQAKLNKVQQLALELETQLTQEKEMSEELASRLENQVPLQDFAKEKELASQVALLQDQLDLYSRAMEEERERRTVMTSLSNEVAFNTQIKALEIALASEQDLVNQLTSKLDHQEPLRDKSYEDQLEKKIQTLQAMLASEKQISDELTAQLENQKTLHDSTQDEELVKEILSLRASLDKEKALTFEMASRLENHVPDTTREKELEKEIQSLLTQLESERNLINDLAKKFDSEENSRQQEYEARILSLESQLPTQAFSDNLVAEMDDLRSEVARENQRREYAIFQSAQKELQYKEQLLQQEKIIQRLRAQIEQGHPPDLKE